MADEIRRAQLQCITDFEHHLTSSRGCWKFGLEIARRDEIEFDMSEVWLLMLVYLSTVIARSPKVKEWIAVLKAADAAARWHVHQRRKGAAQEPYINHLLEVASLVAEATDGNDPNLVIAALLHDAIEDQEVPREIIGKVWGKDVADLVAQVTDDKQLDKATRKQKQVETAPSKSSRAKLIKLADKTSNLRAITASPSPQWSVKRRLEYVAWARDVVAGLRGTSEWLEGEFDRAAEAAEDSVRP